jgi:hypothetical protein
MTQRILGPTGSPRRRRFLGIPILLAVLGALFVVTSSQAVHDAGVFQLDGNAQTSVDSNPTALEDWDLICKANPSTCTFKETYTPPGGTTTATASSHVDDGSLNGTIFHGNSKDTGNIDTWRWKNDAGGLPDKDNLLHAYAARYQIPASDDCPNGSPPAEGEDWTGDCSLIYFGSDRYANDGDATQAFWFLQKKVETSDVVKNGAFTFTGTHTDGDLLVISEFSNGGTTSTITIYTWQNGALVFETGGEGQKCGGSPADAFCGIVNEALTPTLSPWTFLDKAGSTDFRQGEFFEAGINLSDPSISLDEECFSTFVAETRSSTSTTATLKDFVLGQFQQCSAAMVTTPSSASVTPGTSVTDTAVITGTGSASPPFPSSPPNVFFYICEPSQLTPANTGVCSTGGTQVGASKALSPTATQGVSSATSDAYDTTGKAPGKYCFRGEWAGDANYPDGASDSGANECFTIVRHESALSTEQWVYPNDKATVSTSNATNITGSVEFKLYNNLANCQANGATGLLYSVTQNLPAGTATSKTVETANTSIRVSTDTTVYWRVSYGGDSLHFGRLSNCTENTAVDFTNDAGPGTNVP